MAQLRWRPPLRTESAHSSVLPVSSTSNPWFAVSIGLVGLIVGFGIGKWRVGTFPVIAGSPPARIVQVPPAPTPRQPTQVPAPGGEARIIRMTSENWKFSPTVITVKKGEKVQLEITGISGVHGFGVPTLGINVPVQPGQTVTVDLPTSKAGTFPFLCTIPCGPGHAQMTGQVIID